MKYKKLIMTTFTALTLFGSNSIGYADQLKPFDGIQFSKIDLNNDNLISKTELINHRKREFLFADTNVSFRTKRMMQILDENSNGVLEFDELNSVISNRFGNIFKSLDLNNDGHLNKKEFSKLKKRKG